MDENAPCDEAASDARSGVITAIRVLKDDPLRCAVKVGRRTAAVVQADLVQELGVTVGAAWTDTLAARVRTAEAFDKAWREALRIIRRRDLSSGELRRRLRDKGHADDATRQVVEEMTRKALLDDQAYGRAVIAAQRARKPAGRRLLRQKLYQKRLDAKLIDHLLDEADGAVDAVAEARRLAQQRLKTASMQRCDDATRKRRLWSLLARRGFEPQTIREALAGLAGLHASASDD